MDLHDGDHVMVIHMLNEMGLGARVIGPAPHEGFVWIDLNTMGSHLPQMYRPEELKPIDPQIAAEYGMCSACLGYGLPDDAEVPYPAASIDDLVDIACQECKGSGRIGIRVTAVRTPSMIEVHTHIEDHEFVPEMRNHECRACGWPRDHESHG